MVKFSRKQIIRHIQVALEADSTPVDVITTGEYWDCECKDDYIKSKHEPICKECLANKYENPDSRLTEVIELLIKEISN